MVHVAYSYYQLRELFGCYMAGLLSFVTAAVSAHVLCTPYDRAPVYSTLFEATYLGYICNLSPALLAERPLSFTCCYGKTGLEWIPKSESAQEVDPGEENSPACPAGNSTRDLSIRNPAPCH